MIRRAIEGLFCAECVGGVVCGALFAAVVFYSL